MKTGKRFLLRGIKRLPYRINIIIKYLLDTTTQRRFRYRNIEEIRDIHNGETIYIVGSGPSLDTYPDSFLNDKISMTLHLSFQKLSNPTYTHIAEADRIEFFKINNPDFFKTQGLFCNSFFPLVHPSTILKDIGGIDKSPYFIKYNPRRLHFSHIKKQIEAALTGKDIRYQSNSTCLHTGIWCALILGFKDIYLIGCDHSYESSNKGANEKHYFSSAVVDDIRQRNIKFFKDAYNRMRVFTDEIIKLCKTYGININQILNYDHFKTLTKPTS